MCKKPGMLAGTTVMAVILGGLQSKKCRVTGLSDDNTCLVMLLFPDSKYCALSLHWEQHQVGKGDLLSW